MEHKISAVSEKVDTWQSNYGEMKSYYVQFEGNTEAVKINQKPETPAPEVGQVLTGDIVADKFGKKFQKAAKPGFTVSGGGQSSQPPKQVDHDSMYRCNALNNAVVYATGDKKQKDYLAEEITDVADTFYKWLKGENKGYEAAKATAEGLKAPIADETVDTTTQTVEKSEPLPDFGEEINLDDIPFN